MSTQRDREEFIASVIWEVAARRVEGTNLYDLIRFARQLMREAATLQRLAEAACNGELTEADRRRQRAALKRVTEVCKPWGVVPRYQGDPRGAVLKLGLPSGRTNDWGQTGFCVP